MVWKRKLWVRGVGIDKSELSALKTIEALRRCGFLLLGKAPAIPGYELKRNYSQPRYGYMRCAEYRHESDPDAPIIEILYDRLDDDRHRHYPPLRVRIRARRIDALFGYLQLVEVVDKVKAALGLDLNLSMIELAVDFGGSKANRLALRDELYAPRARSLWSIDENKKRNTRSERRTEYRGGKRSSRWVRQYGKPKKRPRWERVEPVLNRPWLKAHDINDAADVWKICWENAVPFFFGRFDPAEYRARQRPMDRVEADKVCEAMRGTDPNRGLLKLEEQYRRLVRACIKPTKAHALLLAALRKFDAAQKSTKPAAVKKL